MFRQSIVSIFLLCVAILFTACGGGGGGGAGGSGTTTGRFVDSAVSGMRYVTSSGISGVTDATGEYSYAPGDSITFYIGDVEIGQATGASLLTPVSLVPGAIDETNTTVTNIARFLQSLDSDGDPDTGITIDAMVATAATGQSLDFTAVDFDTTAAALVVALRTAAYGDTNTLVNAATAQAHLLGSLLCERAGSFQGTFVQTAGPGADRGTWSFTVASNGITTGTGVSSEGAFGISGNVSSDGTSVVGSVTVGATFSGTIGLDGSVSGTWSSTTFGTSGTYNGNRVAGSASSC